MSRHKVLCRDKEWTQQGLYCRNRAWPRQENVVAIGPYVRSDLIFHVAKESWPRAGFFLSQHSILYRDREFQNMGFPISQHSTLCHDDVARTTRHARATERWTHNNTLWSRPQ